jgi:hypothetical protein
MRDSSAPLIDEMLRSEPTCNPIIRINRVCTESLEFSINQHEGLAHAIHALEGLGRTAVVRRAYAPQADQSPSPQALNPLLTR